MLNFKTFAGINYKEKQIMLFEVSVNDNLEFSMSASIGQLTDVTDINIEDCVTYLEDCDFDWHDYFEEVYQAIPENLEESVRKELEDVIIPEQYSCKVYKLITDCTCTDYEFFNSKTNKLYNFETICAGQCIEEYKHKFVSRNEFTDWLYILWKEFHLKKLPESLYQALKYTYLIEFSNEDIQKEIETFFTYGDLIFISRELYGKDKKNKL